MTHSVRQSECGSTMQIKTHLVSDYKSFAFPDLPGVVWLPLLERQHCILGDE